MDIILSFPVTRAIAVQIRSTKSIYAPVGREQRCRTTDEWRRSDTAGHWLTAIGGKAVDAIRDYN